MKTRQAGGTRGSYRDVISRCRRWYVRLGSLEAELEMRIHVQEIHEEVLPGGTLREAQKQDKGREDTSKCAISSQVLVKEASLLFPQGTWLLGYSSEPFQAFCSPISCSWLGKPL